MSDLNSVDAILAFAIGEEQKAADLYSELAGQAQQAHVKKAFEDFAAEERRHKEILQGIRSGGGLRPAAEKIANLGIAEMMREVEMSPDLDYQQMLIFAMQREKAAFKMYSDLAELAQDSKLKKTLQALAQEEAKHKLRFEIEYDETILLEG